MKVQQSTNWRIGRLHQDYQAWLAGLLPKTAFIPFPSRWNNLYELFRILLSIELSRWSKTKILFSNLASNNYYSITSEGLFKLLVLECWGSDSATIFYFRPRHQVRCISFSFEKLGSTHFIGTWINLLPPKDILSVPHACLHEPLSKGVALKPLNK